MSDLTAPRSPGRWTWFSGLVERDQTDITDYPHVADALERHKREGMELAVRARIIAMSAIAVLITVIVPWPAALYYFALILAFIAIGLLQRRVARVGTSRLELALLFCDLALMTIIAAVPNPFLDRVYPLAFQFQFEVHKYFFILLAMATLAYSWRTIFAVGTWTCILWGLAIFGIWLFKDENAELSAAVQELFAPYPPLADFLDPTRIVWDQRIEEIVLFLLCAFILGISVRRFNNLLLAQASAERERTNLARYFSPNVVDQLSNNDDPLKQVRTQEIGVLFVDIVGFTNYAARRSPEEVIGTLRQFHALLETEVFRHGGTLDKYLGDGLMATFGTPVAGADDAVNAIRCARAMCAAIEAHNSDREALGEPPLRIGVGVHFGPAVLGDIGGDRLEYAVIGNTVNIAARLEALTRPLSVQAIVSDAALTAARTCPAATGSDTEGFDRRDGQAIRGVDDTMSVWTLERRD